MIVLGIDPGYARMGYGVVKDDRNSLAPLVYGVIETMADMPFEQRLLRIDRELKSLIMAHKPDALAIETLFFAANRTTAIAVAEARGVVLLAAAKASIPVFEYSPLQVKQAVVGYGKAEKRQVMEMTRILLSLAAIPKPDDAADALAVAICHANGRIGTNRLLLSGGKR